MTTPAQQGQLMTEAHVEGLLALLVSLDPRLSAPDATTAQIRLSAWTRLLGEVEPRFALSFAERAYQQVRDWPLQPAEILQAWRTDQAAAAASEEQDHRHQTAGQRPRGNPLMTAYVRKVFAAITAGKPWDSVPRPAEITFQLTPEQDARERRCTYWRICSCDHTRCRDGLADDEEVIIGLNGRRYPAVRRCPWCRDALLMAEEQGIAVGPAGRARGKRK